MCRCVKLPNKGSNDFPLWTHCLYRRHHTRALLQQYDEALLINLIHLIVVGFWLISLGVRAELSEDQGK